LEGGVGASILLADESKQVVGLGKSRIESQCLDEFVRRFR
jgi:hypothetical protein